MTRPLPSPARMSSSGMTLVELMVVLVVVSVGILGLAAVQTRTGSEVFKTGQHTRALSIGQSRLELARTAGFAAAVSDSGIIDGFNWNTRVDSVSVGLHQVRVIVSWRDNGTPRTLQLNTLLSMR